MITNFTTVIDNIQFEFQTMNVRKLQLFQVYVMHEGKRIRFHMQVTGNGEFVITDKYHCPEIYVGLEKTLSERILTHGVAVNHEAT